jgi:threonine/homoserine/homoserine lactone efflux protein
VVPWLVGLVILYAVALTQFHDSFLTVIRTLGAFTLAFLGVTLWFNREKLVRNAMRSPSTK